MKPEPDHTDPSPATWIAAALLATLSSWAAAQSCDTPLPAPGASAASGGEKFRLIATQCHVGAALQVRQAAQLALYAAGSVAVALPADTAPAAARADEAAPRTPAPVDGDTGRVLSLAPAITAAAQAYDIDPLLLHAIAHVESRHRAGAVSPAGARGVMQVMPGTARRFGVGDPERTLLDPATNLRASAAYLRQLRDRYGNDLRLMLAAYNAGEGAVQKHGNDVPPYPETQAYVRDVTAIYRRLTATFMVTPSATVVARDASGSPR